MTMSGTADVTVIIPNRDRVRLVLRALLSLARQDMPSVEVILVDDGSREDMTLVRRAVIALGGRFLENPGPAGAAGARAVGVAEARGTHVAFLDSDDWFFPDKLTRQRTQARDIEALGKQAALGCDMAFLKSGRLFHFAQPTYEPGLPIPEYLYARGGLFQTSSLFLNRELALAVPFDTRLPVHQDTDLMVRLFEHGAAIAVTPGPLVAMDAEPRPGRITIDPTRLDAARQWYEERAEGWSAEARAGFLRRDLAFRLANAGRRWDGLRCYLDSLSQRPPLRELISNVLELMLGERMALQMLRVLSRLKPGANEVPAEDPMLRLILEDMATADALVAGRLDPETVFHRPGA